MNRIDAFIESLPAMLEAQAKVTRKTLKDSQTTGRVMANEPGLDSATHESPGSLTQRTSPVLNPAPWDMYWDEEGDGE